MVRTRQAATTGRWAENLGTAPLRNSLGAGLEEADETGGSLRPHPGDVNSRTTQSDDRAARPQGKSRPVVSTVMFDSSIVRTHRGPLGSWPERQNEDGPQATGHAPRVAHSVRVSAGPRAWSQPSVTRGVMSGLPGRAASLTVVVGPRCPAGMPRDNGAALIPKLIPKRLNTPGCGRTIRPLDRSFSEQRDARGQWRTGASGSLNLRVVGSIPTRLTSLRSRLRRRLRAIASRSDATAGYPTPCELRLGKPSGEGGPTPECS